MGSADRQRQPRRGAALAGCVTTALLAVAVPARAADFVVDSLIDDVDVSPGDGACATPSGACTLRAAVMEANASPGADTVTLALGVHVVAIPGSGEDAAAAGDIDITEDISIRGVDQRASILRGETGFDDRLLDIHPGVTFELQDIAVEGGRAPAAPCEAGGGLRAQDADMRLTGCLLAFNVATCGSGGGAFTQGGAAAITGCTFAGNTASLSGGAELRDGTVTVLQSTFSSNAAGGRGAGLTVDVVAASSPVVLEGCVFERNEGSQGGARALHVEGGPGGSTRILDCVVQSNAGGGIYALDVDEMDNCLVRWNAGGGVVFLGDVMRRTAIVENTSPSGAAGLSCVFCVLDGCQVSGNRADEVGGGLYMWGDASDVLAWVLNSTIDGNEAAWDGGGAYVGPLGSLFISNSTITNNRAASGRGGGLATFRDGTNSRIDLVNSIVAGNAAPIGPDCWAWLTSRGFNFIEDPSDCRIEGDETGNVYGADPLLGPLADNGGPTLTRALRPGSPALDAGDPAGCADVDSVPVTTDQRGALRPADGNRDGVARCDMGAFEADPFAGLAIQRAVVLGPFGASPAVATAFARSCRQAHWRLCPEEVVTGDLEGMSLAGEATPGNSPSVWYFEHSDVTDTLKVARVSADLVFHAR